MEKAPRLASMPRVGVLELAVVDVVACVVVGVVVVDGTAVAFFSAIRKLATESFSMEICCCC